VFAGTDEFDSCGAITLLIATFNIKLNDPQFTMPWTTLGLAHEICYNPFGDAELLTIKLVLSPLGL